MRPSTHRAPRPLLPPAWIAGWHKAREQASQYWKQRAPRERRLLRAMGAVLIAAALFTIGLRPAWRTIERWQDELPRLRAQAATVDALIQEAQALKREQGHRIPASDMEEALRASLARAALGGTQHVEKTEDGKGWRVTFDDASPAALFDWLAHAPAPLHLRIAQARIARPSDSLGRLIPARASGTLQLRNADDAADGNRP
ncbi:type II secretion system protein GspM [Bordetella sp. H567]|uniref:type II secretion system protein GspM n=1 Tax=Bordetella sp. H567 TaxID=1697043 RepID=UPI0009F6F9B0|nr:type II secretion system protein GspM [Bordetella sp. H567]